MRQTEELFKLNIANDRMTVSLELNEVDENEGLDKVAEIRVEKEELKKFLNKNKITFGYIIKSIEKIDKGVTEEDFPMVIAKGKSEINGDDGQIHYVVIRNEKLDQKQIRNFRDVMRIPSVEKGEKIAYITDPTNGEKGINIYGNEVKPKPGRPVRIRPGKNVEFKDNDSSFYATESGQLMIAEKYIHVYPLYEVQGDLSLKTGNINFVGSVIIRGNVPTGYSVEAEGDINIYGLVEGASIRAGGNVNITEGLVGIKRGKVQAGLDIKVGYTNQGTLEAGRDIFVENSIIHSRCVAKEHIYCQTGNIIGGTLSAGKTIEAKDIGNRMYTKTELAFGIDKKLEDKEKILQVKKKDLLENKKKLKLIGDRLIEKKDTDSGLNQKEKLLLIKQQQSLNTIINQLDEIEEELSELQVTISDNTGMRLIAKGSIYPNVEVTFLKYTKSIDSALKNVQLFLDNKEIKIQPL